MPISVRRPGSSKARKKDKGIKEDAEKAGKADVVEETQIEVFKEEEEDKKEATSTCKELNIGNSDADLSFQDNDLDKKSKKSKKQKMDLKKAFRNVRSKLSGRKRGKNDVKEISIKPESDTPQECWGSESVTIKRTPGRHSPNSSRSSSANSKTSKVVDLEEDDGIEVVYDAAYHGGEL